MAKRYERLASPQGVGAGQTATVRMPLGLTYHRLDLRMKAHASGAAVDVAAADWASVIDDVRILVDGNVTIPASADYLVKTAGYHGMTLMPGVLPVFLSRPWARTMGGEDTTAYGTAGGISSFTMEIDLKAGITVDDLKIYAVQSPGTAFGSHLRVQRFARSYASVGIDEIADIPRGRYALLGMDVTNANVGDIEIFAAGNRTYVTDKAIRASSHSIAKRVPQAGMTHIDLMDDNRVGDAFPMVLSDFRVKLDFTTAPGAYDLYVTSISGV